MILATPCQLKILQCYLYELFVLLLEILLVFVREPVIGDYLCGYSLSVLHVHFVKSHMSILFGESCKIK